MDFTHDGLSVLRVARRCAPSGERGFPYSERRSPLPPVVPPHRRAMARRNRRRPVRAASIARGIRCLDRRTKRRAEHIFRPARPPGLREIRGRIKNQKSKIKILVWLDVALLRDEPAGQTHAGHAAVPNVAAGLLAVATRGKHGLANFFHKTIWQTGPREMAVLCSRRCFKCRHFSCAKSGRCSRHHRAFSCSHAPRKSDPGLFSLYPESMLAGAFGGLLSAGLSTVPRVVTHPGGAPRCFVHRSDNRREAIALCFCRLVLVSGYARSGNRLGASRQAGIGG